MPRPVVLLGTVSLVVGLLIGLGAPPAAAEVPSVFTFSGAAPDMSSTFDVTSGPDGAVWYVNTTTYGSIGRLAADGTTTTFRDSRIRSPNGITTGSDGNLWITYDAAIAKLTPTGEFTLIPTPGGNPPRQPTLGPDGNVWFASASGYVGRVTPDGVVTTFTHPSVRGSKDVAIGPDGAMWFVQTGIYRTFGPDGLPIPDPYWEGSWIGRIAPDGIVTVLPAEGPTAITAADGQLWFMHEPEVGGQPQPSLGSMTPDGARGPDRPLISVGSHMVTASDGAVWGTGSNGLFRMTPTSFQTYSTFGIQGLAVGPEGAIWAAMTTSIHRITSTGETTEYAADRLNAPGLTVGADGAIWFPRSGGVSRAASDGTIEHFRDASITISSPPVTSADGNVWFGTEHHLVRVSISGVITKFARPAQVFGVPRGLVAAPDGSIWFPNQSRIFRVGPDGTSASFSGTEIGGEPRNLVAGADGNIWFSRGDAIVRVTPTGAAAAFAAPATTPLTAGPDGNLWFGRVSGSNSTISRITPSGTITTFSDPGIVAPVRLVDGHDGALWFANQNDRSISRVRIDGSVTRFPLPTGSTPSELVAGPDGNLWFVVGGSVGRITPGGEVRVEGIPVEDRYGYPPSGLVAGTDGGIWFTGSSAGIGRVQAIPADQVSYTVRYDGQECLTHTRLASGLGFDGPAEVLRRSTQLLVSIAEADPGSLPGLPPVNSGPCELTVTVSTADLARLEPAAADAGYTPEELLHAGGDFIIAVIIALLRGG